VEYLTRKEILSMYVSGAQVDDGFTQKDPKEPGMPPPMPPNPEDQRLDARKIK
jgi:hypothetical protein